MKKWTSFVLLAMLVYACAQEDAFSPLDENLTDRLERLAPNGSLEDFVLPSSGDFAKIPQGKGNPLTREKVNLGKMLFFETGLGRDARHATGMGTFSCGTCHIPSSGFMPGRTQGIADGGAGYGDNGEMRDAISEYAENELDVQGARPISLVNVAYVTNSTWSGKFGAGYVNADTKAVWGEDDPSTEINKLGYDGLESQNVEGLKIHRMVIDDYVLDTLGYRNYFDQAFSAWPQEERYSLLAASFAISAYIRTIVSDQAPFQKWLRGDLEAISDREKRGAILFFGKAGCYRCHKSASLNSMEFQALGVRDLYESGVAYNTGPDDLRNLGRGGFTGKTEDMYKFKVPGLYNMADSPFYFHGSSRHSLRSVVEYFNKGIPENTNVPPAQISAFFHPLNLTDEEMDDLTEFLSKSLRDPNLERYMPERVLSGNCFPNNDPASRHDLGCN